MTIKASDVLIIGGGLAGIFAALRLATENKSVTLVDNSLPEANGLIGGFAKFSGAKFSLPPAGLGLIPIVGSMEKLEEKIEQVWSILEIRKCNMLLSEERKTESGPLDGSSAFLRKYHSVLLTPEEIDTLLLRLTNKIAPAIKVIRGKVKTIEPDGNEWVAHIACHSQEEIALPTKFVFFAGGRLA